jgi:hypothetical protein
MKHPKETMHRVMQPILDTLEGQPGASIFCNYLRDRAGLIADYDRDHYIFRHKSFREFLSGIQSIKISGQPDRLKSLVEHFNRDWWEETLRFFMSLSDDELFDGFMRLFFQSPVSEQLDAHQQTLLQHLVREAPQKKIDALKEHLDSDSLNSHQRRYVMECLKTIGTAEAIKTIENADKNKFDESNLSYARDIVAEASAKPEPVLQKIETKEPFIQNSFRNPFEYNVEYIKIPGGTYQYSVSNQTVTVPELYFCKYPVTNKRYRRFISFLAGKEKELEKELSLDLYAERSLKFAKPIKGYLEYMGKDPGEWKNKFRSRLDDDKKFNGDDQPVVGVAWYAARAYCFWLSCLDAALRKETRLLTGDTGGLASIYRLARYENIPGQMIKESPIKISLITENMWEPPPPWTVTPKVRPRWGSWTWPATSGNGWRIITVKIKKLWHYGVEHTTLKKSLLFAPPASASIRTSIGTPSLVFEFFVPRPQSFSWNSGTLSICYSEPALFFAPGADGSN